MKEKIKKVFYGKPKNGGVLSDIDLKKPSTKVAYACIVLVVFAVVCVAFIPILWVFLSGFKDTMEFASVTPTFFPEHIDLGKIVTVWKKANLGKYFMNSFILCFGCCVVCILSSGLMGFALSKLKVKGTGLVLSVIMWTMLLPGSVSLVPRFMTFLDLPLIHINISNSYLPIWLMAGTNAFDMLLFKNHFDTIPTSYVEAAKIDGCSSLGIIIKIMLPISLPVVTVVGIFCFNSSWSNFLWPYILLKNESLKPVSVAVFELKSVLKVDEYMLGMFLSIVPPLVIFLFFHKWIMEGVNVGGVKG